MLPFKLAMEFSHSKPQTAYFDDGGHVGVPGLAIRALAVEITHAKGWKNRGKIVREETDDMREK